MSFWVAYWLWACSSNR